MEYENFKNMDVRSIIAGKKAESPFCESVYNLMQESPEFTEQLSAQVGEVCESIFDMGFEFILHCALMEMEIAEKDQDEGEEVDE